MSHNPIAHNAIPEWLGETVQVVQAAHRNLSAIETEFLDILAADGVDPRLARDIKALLDALNFAQASISVMDMTSDRVLREVAASALESPAAAAGN